VRENSVCRRRWMKLADMGWNVTPPSQEGQVLTEMKMA
jgi:hypothetical protein